ncbi:MAG: LVIVD repeat-containing protein [Promethearchaeota archaeon]
MKLLLSKKTAKITSFLTLTALFVSTVLVGCASTNKRMELTKISSIDTNGEAMNVLVEGDIAFVLDTTDNNPGGVVIIDVSDPTDPVKLSSFYDGGMPREITIKDDVVFVADGADGLEFLNISDLENPTEIYQYPVNQYASDVEVVDDLLYAANWNFGLEIFNISNPESPVKIYKYSSNSLNCVQVDVQGDIACVTDHKSEYTALRILNISNPSSPQLLDSYSPANVDFWDPMIYGDYLYVGNHALNGGELQIYNITDPTDMVQIGEFDDGGSIMTFNLNDTLAFVADYTDGVEVVDITDPTNPVEIGSFYDGGHAKEVVVKNNLLFVADREDGLEILQAEMITEAVPGFGITSGLIAVLIIVVFYGYKRNSKK